MNKKQLRLDAGNLVFIFISGIGGFLLSLTGLSIGWMVGTLITAGSLSLFRPHWINRTSSRNGLQGFWLRAGQLLLGIQLGQQINLSILNVFDRNWLTITIMLFASIVLALLTGFLLYRFTGTDLVTSLYGTTPGGLSSMVGIAADVGANTAVVSIIQTMRVILVVTTIPFAVSLWNGLGDGRAAGVVQEPLNRISASGLMIAAAAAVIGCFISKRLHMPAPWLIGSMIGVGIAQTLSGLISGHNLAIYWPRELLIIAQLMIGASVGSRLNRDMFAGVARTVVIGLLGSLGLMASMLICALLVSYLTGISIITSILAFAPGGIAEMAATSVVLHADSTFVVAVQVLRVLAICIVLPPVFSIINRRVPGQKASNSYAS
ncbi:AbrB family transcriptional regulator [Sporolactobacillus sp. THM7-4]|nr:AbrB family transcriptional regulator [Sporolactobacillus sp. THM7-4]